MNKIYYNQIELLEWNQLCVSVKDMPENILAEASGNVVFLARTFFNGVLKGKVSVCFFLQVLLHEFVHVYQQAILSSRMQRDEFDAYIEKNQNQLEYEASVIAQSLILSKKWKKILGMFFSKKNAGWLGLCCYRNVKPLTWAVDGYASAYIKNGSKHVDQYKKTIETLSKDYPDDLTKMYLDIQTDCKVTGIHETFTVDALGKLLDDLSASVRFKTAFDDGIIERHNNLVRQINKCNDQIKALKMWRDEQLKESSENDMTLLLQVDKEIEDCENQIKKYKDLIKINPNQPVEWNEKSYVVKTDIHAFRGNGK